MKESSKRKRSRNMATSLPVFERDGNINRYTDYLEPGLIACYAYDKSHTAYDLVGYTEILSPLAGSYIETATGPGWLIDRKYLPGEKQQTTPSGGSGSNYVASGGSSAPPDESDEVPSWLWIGIGILGIMVINKKK
jgi:hypothetical protein